MKTIGFRPGAVNFQLSLVVILVVLFIYIFLGYVEKAEQAIERQSMQQTQRIINSALVVVFATYASQGRLAELADLEGSNPFGFLREYQVLPVTYRGEIRASDSTGLAAGWYYLVDQGDLMYLPFHLSRPEYFRIQLSYDDIDQNRRFDPGLDRFKALRLVNK